MKMFQLRLSRTRLMISNLNNRSVDAHLPLYIFPWQETFNISVSVLKTITYVETEMFYRTVFLLIEDDSFLKLNC